MGLGNCEVRYRLYDDELDLSFEELVEIPMQSLQNFSNVVTVDLSHNSIQYLPNEFALCFENLQRLDLSYNCISNLPENFGMLSGLTTLDLSCNNIRQLDVHFAKLKKLVWLDLTGNKLIPILREVAEKRCNWYGDENYCCAQRIITFMQQVDTFGNSNYCIDVCPKQSNINVGTVEVLFTRTMPPKSKELGTQEGNGVLIEDDKGQFFYVSFGKLQKNLRPQMKSMESITCKTKILSKTLITKSDPSSSKKILSAIKLVRGVLFCIIFATSCTIFVSMTVYPENLRPYIVTVLDLVGLTKNAVQLHSLISIIIQRISIFPVSPSLPEPPPPLGFWNWLGNTISSLFYSLFLNYSTK